MPLRFIAPLLNPDIEPEVAANGDLELAEANHRIANSLALVSGLLRSQASAAVRERRSFSSAEVSGLLLEAAVRIETVGRLHGRLARADAGLGLSELVREVAESIVDSLAGPTLARLTLQLDPCCVAPPRSGLPIALAVGELVTNSLKYAHPTGVPVEIGVVCGADAAGALLIEVSDDGVGLPEGFDPMTSDGFGLRLLRTLAEQMGATLTFEAPGIGLIVRLQFPPAKPRPVDA